MLLYVGYFWLTSCRSGWYMDSLTAVVNTRRLARFLSASWVRRHGRRGVGLRRSRTRVKNVDSTADIGNALKTVNNTEDVVISAAELQAESECPVCLKTAKDGICLLSLSQCEHSCCRSCLQSYVTVELNEWRPQICCPCCPIQLHPNDVRGVLDDTELLVRYERMGVRLALSGESDACWCPSPDCGYVVLAADCSSCPRLECGRPGCSSVFCYHCQRTWHPGDSCYTADVDLCRDPSVVSDLKECPLCHIPVLKMDDGSCNHMTCGFCGAEFCWLCMQQISDLHYLSPSGCTFWGKRPWSRRKKMAWQVGALVGAPLFVTLIAGVAAPVIVIGLPIWTGKKLICRFRSSTALRRTSIVLGGVMLSCVMSPLVALVTMTVGIPAMLAYIYGVVPLTLLQSVSRSQSSADH